jgi:hypothetical protein
MSRNELMQKSDASRYAWQRACPRHTATVVEGPAVLRRAATNVRFGSKADICAAKTHVRFTPNSDRESEIPQNVMSALPPKADMCSALAHVCFGPKADSCTAAKPPRFSGEGGLDHSPMVLGDCRPLIKLTPERHRWDNMFVLQ